MARRKKSWKIPEIDGESYQRKINSSIEGKHISSLGTPLKKKLENLFKGDKQKNKESMVGR